MSDNPYAPPKSAVADSPSQADAAVRPKQVIFALQLVAANYLLGIMTLAVSWDYFSTFQSIGQVAFQQIFGLMLAFWIYYKVYRGRNWARITVLVWATLGALLMLVPAARAIAAAAPAIAKAQMFVGIGINACVLWLLFSSPAHKWFMDQRRRRLSPNKSGQSTREA